MGKVFLVCSKMTFVLCKGGDLYLAGTTFGVPRRMRATSAETDALGYSKPMDFWSLVAPRCAALVLCGGEASTR